MIIARELRKTNIAEYILYMLQIEDSLRACSFNLELIQKHLVDRFKVDKQQSSEVLAWYINLAVMMEKESVLEKGHLQVFVNLVNDLYEFHLKMLEVRKDLVYVNLYAENKSTITELVQKSQASNEIDACFQALYGMMMLKMRNSDISDQTKISAEKLAHLIGHLSARYIQYENDDFEF